MTSPQQTPAELHAWLVARWTEHRATAQAATPGKWDAAHGGNPRSSGVYAYMGPRIAEMCSSVEPYSYDAEHIAANDPAHVVAVCDAALRRLERHAPYLPQWRLGTPIVHVCDHCSDLCHSRSGLMCDDPDAPWPCPEVLDDAAPWAERSDFPQELRHG